MVLVLKLSNFIKRYLSLRQIQLFNDSGKEPEKFVIHAEIHILGTRLMLSDFGGTNESSVDSTMEIVAVFENEEVLREAYQVINDGSKTITPIGPIFFSDCLVSFVDKFGVRWCFMV